MESNNKTLRERLFGPVTPLRDKLYSAMDTPLLQSKPAVKDNPVQVTPEGDALMAPASPTPTPKREPVRVVKEPFLGTNYDPYDPEQTKPEPDGLGKALIKLDESMVATSLKDDGITGNLRLGTVIRVPSLGNKVFLVADTMNQRFNGKNKIDFVKPNKKKEPDPEVNKEFPEIEILREGEGAEDARKFVDSGEWERLKKEYN